MGDLTAADPLAVVVSWLKAHAAVAAEFGGPDHVSGLREGPWPHILVEPGQGGDLGDGTWLIRPEVTLTVFGDPDGSPGRAELYRLAMVAFQAVKGLEDRSYSPGDGQPVVSEVRPTGAVAWNPLRTGQGSWTFGVFVSLHPPVG